MLDKWKTNADPWVAKSKKLQASLTSGQFQDLCQSLVGIGTGYDFGPFSDPTFFMPLWNTQIAHQSASKSGVSYELGLNSDPLPIPIAGSVLGLEASDMADVMKHGFFHPRLDGDEFLDSVSDMFSSFGIHVDRSELVSRLNGMLKTADDSIMVPRGTDGAYVIDASGIELVKDMGLGRLRTTLEQGSTKGSQAPMAYWGSSRPKDPRIRRAAHWEGTDTNNINKTVFDIGHTSLSSPMILGQANEFLDAPAYMTEKRTFLDDLDRASKLAFHTKEIISIDRQQLEEAISSLNPEILTYDVTRTLLRFAPSREEVQKASAYLTSGGTWEDAGPAEQFVIMTIHLRDNLDALYLHLLQMEVTANVESIDVICTSFRSACEKIMRDTNLHGLMFLMLRVSNSVYGISAPGFKLSSLTWMCEEPIIELQKRTVLEQAVELLIKGEKQNLNLKSDSRLMEEASTFSLSEVSSLFEKIHLCLERLRVTPSSSKTIRNEIIQLAETFQREARSKVESLSNLIRDAEQIFLDIKRMFAAPPKMDVAHFFECLRSFIFHINAAKQTALYREAHRAGNS